MASVSGTGKVAREGASRPLGARMALAGFERKAIFQVEEPKEPPDRRELPPDGAAGETAAKTPPQEAPEGQTIDRLPFPVRGAQVLRQEPRKGRRGPSVRRDGVVRELSFVAQNLEERRPPGPGWLTVPTPSSDEPSQEGSSWARRARASRFFFLSRILSGRGSTSPQFEFMG